MSRFANYPGGLVIPKLMDLAGSDVPTTIVSIRHPEYSIQSSKWAKWRLVYEAGDNFIENYLKKFSSREGETDFNLRKDITPIPSFAKAAINDIKNSIFQRTV